MSSTPFWQNTTSAPDFFDFVTMSCIMLFSWLRNACIWVGSLMRISALNSVFSISRLNLGVRFLRFLSLRHAGVDYFFVDDYALDQLCFKEAFACFLDSWMLSMSAIVLSPRFQRSV
jgi:hypothetical protein